MSDVKAELARLEAATLIMARRMNSLERRLKEVEQMSRAVERAILELDSTLRRSGVLADGDWVLSLAPPAENPGRQSADDRPTIHDS